MKELKNIQGMQGCVGCALCANLCSQDAITMKMGENGFIVPEVDAAKCVDCGLCLKRCIVNDLSESKPGYQEEVDTYAAWNNDDEVRLKSSSGGIFSAVAETIIAAGGCVYGVKWKDKYRAEFVCVETADELKELRGSKYLPAFTCNAYREIKKKLTAQRKVLFSGTPCQVHALRQYLRKDYENLFTIDIVCHGMPSYNIFKLYVNEFERESGKTLERLNFRDKKESWSRYNLSRVCTDGHVSDICRVDDDFMRMFLSNKALNATCYNCPYIRHGRQGDITLGDFWGIQRYFPELQTGKGVSVVLVNSDKGRKVWEKLTSNGSISSLPATKEMIASAASYTIQFTPYPERSLPEDREEVLALLRREQILSPVASAVLGARKAEAVTCGERNVGVLGWWYAKNYGAQLTALALYKLIENMGWYPTMISHAIYRMEPEEQLMRKLGVRYTPLFQSDEEFEKLNNHFSTFVVGSDQLWRYRYIRNSGRHAYYLNFAKPGKRRIAYGTSFGTNPCEAPDDFRLEASFNLDMFSGVSSREREGVEVLKKQYHTDAAFVLDPVFMCSAEQYREWASFSNLNLPQEDYVCSYIMDKDEDGSICHLIQHVCNREQAAMINLLNQAQFNQIKESFSLGNIIDDLKTEDWLNYIANCKHLITNSFHGLCFAIIFNKPFTVIGNAVRGNSRFISLLNEFGMAEYLLESTSDLGRVEQLPPMNWSRINATLNQLREKSALWLKEQLNKPVSTKHRNEQFLYSKIKQVETSGESCIEQLKVVSGKLSENEKQIKAAEQTRLTLANKTVQLEKSVAALSQKLTANEKKTAHLEQTVSQLSQLSQQLNMVILQNYSYFRLRCLYYGVMKQMTWGKKKEAYRRKRRNLKNALKQARSIFREIKKKYE